MSRFDKRKRPGSNQGSHGHLPRSQGRGPTTPASAALVVFAKAPIEGYVKTRLCPPLTDDEAASLHGSLVMDMMETCQAVKGCDRILAASPTSQHPFFKAMAVKFGVELREQTGEDLGARMAQVFQDGLGSPYRSLVIVGTDIPGITSRLITDGMAALREVDLVLGPTHDGGYYLIGLRKPAPDLFQDIPWSTDQVYAMTEQKARTLGLSLRVLPTLRDIDTVEDLKAVTQIVKAPGNRLVSPRTKNVLMELDKRLKARFQ